MGELRMPSLGADMDAGTLVEWRVGEGTRVKRGDIVALVETQKGIVEIEIWESGVIAKLVVEPGSSVPVGTVLAVVAGEEPREEPAPAPPHTPVAVAERANADGRAANATNGHAGSASAASLSASAADPPRAGAPPPSGATPAATSWVRASPAARQRARERGVDLATLEGTGPHGVVTRADVDRARSSNPAPERASERVSEARGGARSGMRRAIAAAMARSKREIPHHYLGAELDVSRATRWLEAENARRPVTERVLFAALLIKATARAIAVVPELNGFFLDGEFRPSARVHVGVAIALRDGGLVAPAIHDADQKSPVEIMVALQDLVTRARGGALRASEMTDPTITLTNLGDQGTDSVFGVITPPQVAIVGFGRVRERPWAEGGMLGIRPVVVASVAADHRVSDGHRGARFLAAIGRHLDEPESL